MKFFKGQDNARVYCKEVTLNNKKFIVIAAELLTRKKQNKLTYKELNIIHRVASYLTQLLNGDRLLNLKTIAKIEDALHIRFELKAVEVDGKEISYSIKNGLEMDQTQVNES